MLTDLTPPQIDEMLKGAYYGHLGCHMDDQIYVVPITFVYKDNALLAYTTEGKKVELMRANPKVCVQTEKINKDGSWESVMMWGTFKQLDDANDRQQACMALAAQFANISSIGGEALVSPLIRDISNPDWEKIAPIVYKIDIEKMTGKSEKA